MEKDITKNELSKFHMHELWKICAELGIKRGKHDKKGVLVNKIYSELNGDSIAGDDLAGDTVAGDTVAGEVTFTLSGYDFLNVLLKHNNIGLSKLYKKPCSLERRKQNGNYNMFFITKDKKIASKVLSNTLQIKDFRHSKRIKVSDGGWFSSPRYKTSAYYKIPFENISDKEVKHIVNFIKDND